MNNTLEHLFMLFGHMSVLTFPRSFVLTVVHSFYRDIPVLPTVDVWQFSFILDTSHFCILFWIIFWFWSCCIQFHILVDYLLFPTFLKHNISMYLFYELIFYHTSLFRCSVCWIFLMWIFFSCDFFQSFYDWAAAWVVF